MSPQLTIQDFVERNKHIAAIEAPNEPLFSELGSLGRSPPKIVIITCADPRCVPERFLALKSMEAIIFRNPGGHVAPALNAILALDNLTGGFLEVMIIHHNDCGASMYTEAGIRDALKKRVGADDASIDGMNFGAITDIVQSVKDDIAELKASRFVRPELKEHVSGFMYDVKTGLLTEVEE